MHTVHRTGSSWSSTNAARSICSISDRDGSYIHRIHLIRKKSFTSLQIADGIQAVDPGQMEAARSIGFTYGESMRKVILPQAVKNILPALGNEFVTVIKESSIVSVIGIADLMFRTNDVIAVTYRSLQALLIAALLYFVMTFITGRLVSLAERKMKNGR